MNLLLLGSGLEMLQPQGLWGRHVDARLGASHPLVVLLHAEEVPLVLDDIIRLR